MDYERPSQERYGLSAGHALVAPNYAAKRSEFAKAFRLGVKLGEQGWGLRVVVKPTNSHGLRCKNIPFACLHSAYIFRDLAPKGELLFT